MLKTRLWVALFATPVVIASAFCATPVVIASVGNFSWFGSRHELSPERMMSIAQTFERQGRITEAKELYEQILAKKPDSEEARARLTKLIAAEQGTNRKPASATVAQNKRVKNSVAGKAPAAVPTQVSRVDSRPIERPSNSLGQRPTQANPVEYVPPSPKQTVTTVTHRESPKAAAAEQDRSSVNGGVPSRQAAHDSRALPEEHSFVSPTKPQPNSFRGIPEATPDSGDPFDLVTDSTTLESTSSDKTSKDEADTQDEWQRPIIHSPSGVDAQSTDRRSGILSTEAMDGKFEPGFSRSPAETTQSMGSQPHQGGLIRSTELQTFFRVPYKRLVAIVWERRADLKPHLVLVATDEAFHLDDRTLAVFLLGTLGSEAGDTLPRLRETMRTTQDSYLQIDLAQAVLLIQPEDAEAIDVLLELLHAPDDTVQWYTAFALRHSASPRTTFVIDALLKTLVSDNHRLNRMVFLTLGAFGPTAAKAVPQLEAALDSPDPMTRVIAEASLAAIVPGRQRGLSVVQKPKLNQLRRFD